MSKFSISELCANISARKAAREKLGKEFTTAQRTQEIAYRKKRNALQKEEDALISEMYRISVAQTKAFNDKHTTNKRYVVYPHATSLTRWYISKNWYRLRRTKKLFETRWYFVDTLGFRCNYPTKQQAVKAAKARKKENEKQTPADTVRLLLANGRWVNIPKGQYKFTR